MWRVVFLLVVVAALAIDAQTWFPRKVLTATFTVFEIDMPGVCVSREVIICPSTNPRTGFNASCANNQAACLFSTTPVSALAHIHGEQTHIGRPRNPCTPAQMGTPVQGTCVYNLFVSGSTQMTVPYKDPFSGVTSDIATPITVTLATRPYGEFASVYDDPAIHAVKWHIPNNAIWLGGKRKVPVYVVISGETINAISDHFTHYHFPPYYCCDSTPSVPAGIVMTIDKSIYNVSGRYEYTTSGVRDGVKKSFKIGRVYLIPIYKDIKLYGGVGSREVVGVTRIGSNPARTPGTDETGIVSTPCFMVPIAPADQNYAIPPFNGPTATCSYTIDLATWNPVQDNGVATTSFDITMNIQRTGAPGNTTSEQFRRWQQNDIIPATRTVNVLPWPVSTPGYVVSRIAQTTFACAQTGCAISVVAQIPCPRYTTQPAGGDAGFEMLMHIQIGQKGSSASQYSHVAARLTARASNVTTANPLYTMFIVSFVYELENLLPITTNAAFVADVSKVTFYTTYWDYTAATPFQQKWMPPNPATQPGHDATLKFYNPVTDAPKETATAVVTQSEPFVIISFTAVVVRGLGQIAFPVTPKRYPMVVLSEAGKPANSIQLTYNESSNPALRYTTPTFVLNGEYKGQIRLDRIPGSVVAVGRTYVLKIHVPFFEGPATRTPGKVWWPDSVFPDAVHPTFTLTPTYAAFSIECFPHFSNGRPGVQRGQPYAMHCDATHDNTVTIQSTPPTSLQVYALSAHAPRLLYQNSLPCNETLSKNTVTYKTAVCLIDVPGTVQFLSSDTAWTAVLHKVDVATGVVTALPNVTIPLRAIPPLANYGPNVRPSVVRVPLVNTTQTSVTVNVTAPIGIHAGDTITSDAPLKVTWTTTPSVITSPLLSFKTSFAQFKSAGFFSVPVTFPLSLLNTTTAIQLTISSPYWTGSSWEFPTTNPATWPILTTTLIVLHDKPSDDFAKIAATPPPAKIPPRLARGRGYTLLSVAVSVVGTAVAGLALCAVLYTLR